MGLSRFPGFIGATYQSRSIKADCERCLNLYPELIESRNAPNGEIGYLPQVPGLRRLATIGPGPIRGVYTTPTGRLAVVSGNKLYSVSPTWGPIESGTLMTFSGPVDMADNGIELCLVDGLNGYVVSLLTGKFQQITAEGFMGGDRICFIDGYLLVNHPKTGQFQISGSYDALSWDGLDFGVAEGLPDAIVAVVANNRQMWALGQKSVEVYWNNGNADFPFARIDGSFIEHGCAAAQTAQKFAGTIAWLSDKGQVLMANGWQPVRISNHAVELAIREAGDISSAYAWTHAFDGHTFYCLQIPGVNTTWCYDHATSQWHERADLVGGRYQPFRASGATFAYGTWVVGDKTDGRIYALDPEACSFDGDPRVWERIPPRLNSQGTQMFVPRIQLDMEVGVGLDGSQQGSDPKVMMQISRDGGMTWGTERQATAGALGAYRHRADFRQCGMGRDLAFRFHGSDPVRTVILGANIEFEMGVS